jgi:hypothetical protein
MIAPTTPRRAERQDPSHQTGNSTPTKKATQSATVTPSATATPTERPIRRDHDDHATT